MVEIIKISILGILCVILALQFKAQKPEFGLLIGISISLLIFGFSLGQIKSLVSQFEQLKQYVGGAGNYFGVLVKVIGITYICEFSAGICKDAGFGAVSDQIEILGKLSVLFAGMPLLFAVLQLIQEMC